MVPRVRRPANPQSTLSVLALSSRFDGHVNGRLQVFKKLSFSTRSVESF